VHTGTIERKESMETTQMTQAAESLAREPILLREDDNGITTLTLNRPRQYNTLSEAMLTALHDTLKDIEQDDSVRVVILAGAGKAYCAGHDLKEMRARPDQEYYRELFRKCSEMMLTMNRIPQPIIARVHGIATAAGCQLVATADLAVASTEASFATSGINVGLFCATPGVPLSRNILRKHAMEMLLTGEFISAEGAARLGLVNRAVEPGLLDERVMSLARHITDRSPVAVRTGKQMFYRQIDKELESAYDFAAEVMACNMMAEDAAEGIDAFIEKRDPVWRGR
jgi:enoyl-CoA hydratase/carnithine racemase